ncbi:MAG: acetyl-CoA carboxylase carboxyltransferase subunit beta [Ruminococcaceae bacterium]|nr:acetyl-CoA carboxylase carboxyltransferase subunit beta [Oscillospiraceae bacterium]
MPKFNFKKSRNRLEGLVNQLTQPSQPAPNVPDSLCVPCPGCEVMLFTSELAENLNVCPQCGHHFRLSAPQRIQLICDAGSFTPWDEGLASKDPLQFPGYAAKLRHSRLKTGGTEEVLCGAGSIAGTACAVFAMDQDFMMGSMGSVVGEKITRLFERATRERLPVVGFTLSGGARMQEGILSLMQMAKTSGAVKYHSEAGLLYITVLTDPTTGGVTASFGMEGDILLAEPGALIGFAGPRVIEQTMRQKLPKGFQKAEFLLEKGFLDAVIPRKRLKATLAHILRLHREEEPHADGSV